MWRRMLMSANFSLIFFTCDRRENCSNFEMEQQLDGDNVIVQPKTTYLSADELVSYHDAYAWQKRDSVSSNQNQSSKDKMSSLFAALRMSISSPRIEHSGGGSLAVWDREKCMAHVVRKEGKYDVFGITIEGQLYLEFFETLYLVETGRLQLQYYGRLLSMEQAYLLLLGEGASKNYCEYLAYAHLTRAGFILIRHKNQHFQNQYSENFQPTGTDCIWAWLSNAVQNSPVPNVIKKTQMYANIKRKVESIKSNIIEQEYVDGEVSSSFNANTDVPMCVEKLESTENDITENQKSIPTCSSQLKPKSRKRKQDDTIPEPPIKYFCKRKSTLLDCVASVEYKKLAKTFKKFESVQIDLTQKEGPNDEVNKKIGYDDDDDDGGGGEDGNSGSNETDESVFSFDLYLHNNSFKKSSPPPPLIRVIVLPSSENFPNHTKITQYHRSLFYPTTILIISVGDSKQIQGFLYFFS